MKQSAASLIFSLIAFSGAFLVTFVIPDFDFDNVLIIASTLAALLGVMNFRAKFESAVAFFKTKTIAGAIITAVPMVIFALAGFFHFNLPDFIVEGLKYLVQMGGGWMLIGSSKHLTKS